MPQPTAETTEVPDAGSVAVRRFRLVVVEGPGTGAVFESQGDRCSIGSHASNDLVVADPTVSRFHAEVAVEGNRVRIRDLGSRNGTVVDGVQLMDGFLRQASTIRFASTGLRFELAAEVNRLPLSARRQFGALVGESPRMRAVFGLLERAAATDSTVLLEGETGTGKGQAAEAVHRASARAGEPFVVVDCSAIPENLLESELFGHEKGAFTGAEARRVGAFEEATGGTIFLDELGELGPALQPKLLRVLENREIRRVGGSGTRPVNVRVIAATHHDLRAEVNAGRFRADLYYRLAVLKVTMPSLRQRPEDLPALARTLLERLGASPEQRAQLATDELLAGLQRAAWPGNVRELRNYLERCLVYQDALPLFDDEGEAPSSPPPEAPASGLTRQPLARARDEIVEAFERRYLEELLRTHGGRMTAAAQAAGIGRVYLYKLLVRHGLKAKG